MSLLRRVSLHRQDPNLIQSSQSVVAETKPGRGRRPLNWTPSRQRKLIRLTLDYEFEWNDVPTAMAEPGFTPSRSNCIEQWNTLSNVTLGELQVKDPIKKQQRKEERIRAFEIYKQQHEPPGSDMKQTSLLPPVELDTGVNTFKGFCTALRSHQLSTVESPPTSPLPPLSLGVRTPSDYPDETQTPKDDAQDLVRFHTSSGIDIVESPATPHPPLHLKRIIPNSTSQKRKKRDLPVGFYLSDPLTKGPSFRFKTSYEIEKGWPQESSANSSRTAEIVVPQKEAKGWLPGRSKCTDGDHEKAIANLEEKYALPRGFIDYIRLGLSISRYTIVSAWSSSGKEKSRPTPRLSRQSLPDLLQAASGTNKNQSSNKEALQTKQDKQRFQNDLSRAASGRAETNIFWELSLGGASDAEVAARLESLIRDGADVNMRNNEDEDSTPLHVALRYGNLVACRVLLENGVNVNAQNIRGETPLHIAVCYGNRAACVLLLKHGADVYARTYEGRDVSCHGKVAEKRAGDNSKRYLEIKSCRNLIRDRSSFRRTQTASLANQQLFTEETTRTVPIPPNADSTNKYLGMATQSRGETPLLSSVNSTDTFTGTCHFTDGRSFDEAACRNKRRGRWNTGTSLNFSNYTSDSTHASTSEDIQPKYMNDIAQINTQDIIPGFVPPGREFSTPILGQQLLGDGLAVRSPSRNGGAKLGQNKMLLSASKVANASKQNSYLSLTPTQHPSSLQQASMSLNQQLFPVPPQQSIASSVFDNISLDKSPTGTNSGLFTHLSGYVQKLSTEEWALVCPLTNNKSWQYVTEMFNTSSLTAVKVISPPAIHEPNAAPQMSSNSAEDRSDAQFPYGRGVLVPSTVAAPARVDPCMLGPNSAFSSTQQYPVADEFMTTNTSHTMSDTSSMIMEPNDLAVDQQHIPGWDFNRSCFQY